ncbi:UBC-like protein [Abortiporus biennis]|nr:UBC-like protein [Abortiporus biennis]
MAATRRIQKELADIKKKPIDGLKVEVEDDNLFKWKGTIKAAADSPYKGGSFQFDFDLPENFPFKPPTVTFKTKIYHPGIDEEGHICVPVLRDQWKPAVTLYSGMGAFQVLNIDVLTCVTVLLIIQEKLNNPSPDDPFEPDIAALLKNDKSKFLATAKEWTKRHAT